MKIKKLLKDIYVKQKLYFMLLKDKISVYLLSCRKLILLLGNLLKNISEKNLVKIYIIMNCYNKSLKRNIYI